MDDKSEQILMKNLASIAASLEVIARGMAPKAPAFVKTLEEFLTFDWDSIGAVVKQKDQYGAAVVEYGGYTWMRRSPTNKFAEVIYFSRPDGKKEDGTTNYQRLVTFKAPTTAEPINRKVESQLAEAEKKKAPAPVPPVSIPGISLEPAAGGLKSNGHTRPFEPDYLVEKIKAHAEVTFAGKKASPDDRGKLAATMQLCFAGLDDWRERMAAAYTLLTGSGSDLEMSDAYVLAMLKWLDPKKAPVGGSWNPDTLSVQEAGKAARLVLKK
jgi:hypothetical protein